MTQTLNESQKKAMLLEMGIVSWRSRVMPEVPVQDNLVVEQAPALSAVAVEVEAMPHDEEMIVTPLANDEIPYSDVDLDEVVIDRFEPDNSDLIIVDEPIHEMDQIAQEVHACTRCGLCQTRHQAVVGFGDRQAKWLFVGEGPGYAEDEQGLPFVGRSGQLLDNMLLAMGLARGKNVYIANILKCRAIDEHTKDRRPSPEEISACYPYLQRQIALICPDIIVALGHTAASTLLGVDDRMGALRQKSHVFTQADKQIPLVVTYHPSYLLRTPTAKKDAWHDLCRAMTIFEQTHNK